jgi:hypothetical protein
MGMATPNKGLDVLSKLRSPTYANVVASIALFIALGGTSYGLATGSIGSREIKNNSVRSDDRACERDRDDESSQEASRYVSHRKRMMAADRRAGTLRTAGLSG